MNEDRPVFQGGPYSTSILESLAVNSPIGVTATATDPEGHGVSYAISTNLPDGVFFNIDEMSGVISLAHVVDSDPPNSHSQLMLEVCAV